MVICWPARELIIETLDKRYLDVPFAEFAIANYEPYETRDHATRPTN